jgi:hypothetical protein
MANHAEQEPTSALCGPFADWWYLALSGEGKMEIPDNRAFRISNREPRFVLTRITRRSEGVCTQCE